MFGSNLILYYEIDNSQEKISIFNVIIIPTIIFVL